MNDAIARAILRFPAVGPGWVATWCGEVDRP
jgi:hypothetical protein